MFFLLFLLSSGLAGNPPLELEPQLKLENCPMFWYSFNGRCFKYVSTQLTWAEAELHCVSQNANLVSIHSVEEQDFVRNLIKNFDHREGLHWIGLTDAHKEGWWMWSDGSAVNFVFWDKAEPNNLNQAEHCAHNNFGTVKRWNDEKCSWKLSFVCVSHSSHRY